MKFKKFFGYFPYLLIFLFVLIRAYFYYNAYLSWNVYLGYDDAVYAMLAKKMLEGDFYYAFHPYWNPGLPLASIPFYLITQSWEIALVLVSMVSSTLLIPVVFLTIKKYSVHGALIASFIVSVSVVYPRLTLFSGFTEPLYILFFWLSIIFGYETFRTRSVKNYFLTGLFFGITFFIRTEVIVAMGVFLLVAIGSFFLRYRKKLDFKKLNYLRIISFIFAILSLVHYPLLQLNKTSQLSSINFRPPYTSIALCLFFLLIIILSFVFERNNTKIKEGLKSLIPKVITFVLIFILINLPYLTTISIKLGKPTLSGKYSYLTSGHPFSPEKDRLTTWAQDIWAIDIPNYKSPYYDSARVMKLYFMNLENSFEAFSKLVWFYMLLYGYENTFSQTEMYLAIIGIFAGILLPKYRNLTLYLYGIWITCFVWIVMFMAISNRYLAYSFPMIALAQAFAVYLVGILIRNMFIRINFLKSFSGFVLPLWIFIFMIIYISSQPKIRNLSDSSKIERNFDQKLIGEYLKSQGARVIMVRTEGISFYSGAKLVYVPAATPEVIVQFAKVWDVDFIVSRPVESSWDYMREIVNPNYKNPYLSLARKYEDGTIIWKVAKDR